MQINKEYILGLNGPDVNMITQQHQDKCIQKFFTDKAHSMFIKFFKPCNE